MPIILVKLPFSQINYDIWRRHIYLIVQCMLYSYTDLTLLNWKILNYKRNFLLIKIPFLCSGFLYYHSKWLLGCKRRKHCERKCHHNGITPQLWKKSTWIYLHEHIRQIEENKSKHTCNQMQLYPVNLKMTKLISRTL